MVISVKLRSSFHTLSTSSVPNNPSGFIINISELKRIVNEYVISIIDHSQIQEDIEWFQKKQPSTENLVIFIWNQLNPRIEGKMKLYKIILFLLGLIIGPILFTLSV